MKTKQPELNKIVDELNDRRNDIKTNKEWQKAIKEIGLEQLK